MPSEMSSRDASFQQEPRTLNGSGRGVWRRSAPAAVREAFLSDRPADGWAAWREHLAGRKRPTPPQSILPGAAGGLNWALPDGSAEPPAPDWLLRAGRLLETRFHPGQALSDPAIEKDLLNWLGEAAAGTPSADYALDALAVCHAMPRLAAAVTPEVWWALLDHLVLTATQAGGAKADDRPLEDNPLLHQLLAGELALTLAYLFPEITACRELRPAARRALSAGPVDLLDGEGLPHAKHLPLLRPLLACWTRCRAIGSKSRRCFNSAAEIQYEWLVRHALRMTRADGSHVFSDGASPAWPVELFETALHFGGNEDDEAIAALVLPKPWKSKRKPAGEHTLPEPANHSEWAATTVLRRRWAQPTEQFTVLYDEPAMRVELTCGKDVVLHGVWQFEVRQNGKVLAAKSDWNELCWVSDKTVDYLELEIELSGNVRLQRSMLLARRDRFLLLADAVLSEGRGEIDYRGRLPLGGGIAFEPAEQSREGLLIGSNRRARVLPLALPEWRAEKRVGELAHTSDGLELRQSQEDGRLLAPLFADLDRRRHRQKCTWRQLTVAQSLQIQPPEVAAGYRVALGDQHQWLIYRSLAPKANRTLLSHNLSTEMLVARFGRSGEVDPLVEIE